MNQGAEVLYRLSEVALNAAVLALAEEIAPQGQIFVFYFIWRRQHINDAAATKFYSLVS